MKIAILSRGPKLYSTQRLKEAAEKRDHEPQLYDVLKCYVVLEKGKPVLRYNGQKVEGVDALIPRVSAKRTFYGTAIVRQFEAMKVFTTASSQAIVRSRDKLRSMQVLARAGVAMPVTCFASNPQDTDDLIQQVGGAPLVIKLLEGTQGIGVMLAMTEKSAKSIIEAFHGVGINILVQEFIHEAESTDIRALVVDGKVVGAMRRQGVEGEFRSNLHRGGEAISIELTPEEEKMALKAARAMKLPVAGVDMLPSKRGPLLMEVNSSPGLEGIEGATKLDIAGAIIEYIEKKLSNDEDSDVDM